MPWIVLFSFGCAWGPTQSQPTYPTCGKANIPQLPSEAKIVWLPESLTAKAPENKPGPRRKLNHLPIIIFSGASCSTSGVFVPKEANRNPRTWHPSTSSRARITFLGTLIDVLVVFPKNSAVTKTQIFAVDWRIYEYTTRAVIKGLW